MGCIKKLASFANSRIRTRRPTKRADTYDVNVQIDDDAGVIDTTVDPITENEIGLKTTNGNTIIAFPDPLTTYITLRNTDSAEAMYYSYVDEGESDNFDITVEGMLLRAGDSVDIEVVDSAVIGVSAHSDNNSAINCRVDKGIG